MGSMVWEKSDCEIVSIVILRNNVHGAAWRLNAGVEKMLQLAHKRANSQCQKQQQKKRLPIMLEKGLLQRPEL